MKIRCLQEAFSAGLSAVKPAVSTKSALPILSHILLDAGDDVPTGRVRLAATNLDLSIVSLMPAEVDVRGGIAVPSRIITDFVSTLPEGAVSLTLNSQTQTLRVQSGRMSANVKGIDAKEFPQLPTFPKESVKVALDAKGLREMLDRVTFAAATDDSRPVLTGVLVQFEQKRLTLGAADGFRLSVQHAGIGESTGLVPFEPFSLVIPVKAIQEVGRLCADQVEPVKLTVSPNRSQVRFTLTTVEVTSQLISGVYPELGRIIPDRHTTRVIVNPAELLSATKIASAVLDKNGKENGVRLDADPANGRVVVMAAHAERGDGVGDIDAVIEGEPFKVGLQAPYLLSLLERITAPQLSIEYVQTGGNPLPVVLRPVGDDDFVHVMMPLVDVLPHG
jgi:DNA polymerase-3 subunit beta